MHRNIAVTKKDLWRVYVYVDHFAAYVPYRRYEAKETINKALFHDTTDTKCVFMDRLHRRKDR